VSDKRKCQYFGLEKEIIFLTFFNRERRASARQTKPEVKPSEPRQSRKKSGRSDELPQMKKLKRDDTEDERIQDLSSSGPRVSQRNKNSKPESFSVDTIRNRKK